MVKIFKERDAIEWTEIRRGSHQTESIYHISVAIIRFSRVSDSPLRFASNIATED